MPIEVVEPGMFHLYTNRTSYVLKVDHHGQLIHVYWGPRISPGALTYAVRATPILAFSPTPHGEDEQYSLDVLPQECPTFGRSDFRAPLCQVRYENGSTVSEFVFKSHRIFLGKPPLSGLPSLRVDADDAVTTLEIRIGDAVSQLDIVLRYSVYDEFDVVTRSVEWLNAGDRSCELLRALSMTVDFSDANYRLLHLVGAWAREAEMVWTPLGVRGTVSVESRRGASSHQAQPFLALARPDVTRHHGAIYAANLIYSGNFLAFTEVDQYQQTRIGLGINPFDFTWLLKPGESFQSPEAVMVFSDHGLNGMSQHFHQIYRERLGPGPLRARERPIILNTWEASYFKIDAPTIEAIAEHAAGLGVEMVVVDDGWFDRRDNDRSSLGDWQVDRQKFPNGLAASVAHVKEKGMGFGLWVEPEMVSPDSDLYRSHPDWCLEVADRPASLARHQRVLDLSRPDVQTFIIDRVSQLIRSLDLDYLKWDMNRHMTEVGSNLLPPERQRETAHRYILGLYRVLRVLTEEFPHVFIEGCSGGGGRFDAGMLAYCPQIWTSDNTDAKARLKIQQGTALLYPMSAISAHVSDVPNHQTGRITPLDFRGMVAMSGVLGYELDPQKLSLDERAAIQAQIKWYKEVRPLVQFGQFTVLDTFDPENEYAWMFADSGEEQALVCYFRLAVGANIQRRRLRVVGLTDSQVYDLREVGQEAWKHTNGGELRNVGILVPDLRGDYRTVVWQIRKSGR